MTAISKMPGKSARISRNKVRLLWYCDFWDVPINGLCEYDGRKFWFQKMDDTDASSQYAVIDLSAEEVADEERWHELFRAKVGTHCDFDEPHPEIRPKETHREFYDPFHKRPKRDYADHPVVGWFEMYSASQSEAAWRTS